MCLKGQCHEMGIFLEDLNILISTVCVSADGFQDLSKAFYYPILNYQHIHRKYLFIIINLQTNIDLVAQSI
jgi:hypothetical protein